MTGHLDAAGPPKSFEINVGDDCMLHPYSCVLIVQAWPTLPHCLINFGKTGGAVQLARTKSADFFGEKKLKLSKKQVHPIQFIVAGLNVFSSAMVVDIC